MHILPDRGKASQQFSNIDRWRGCHRGTNGLLRSERRERQSEDECRFVFSGPTYRAWGSPRGQRFAEPARLLLPTHKRTDAGL